MSISRDMERLRSEPGVEPSEVRRRLQSIAAGVWLSYAAVVVLVAYALITWDQPGRTALVLALVGVFVGSSVLWLLPRERIVRGRQWLWFFLAWSTVDIAAVLAIAGIDGGAASPLALVLVVPLVFAAVFYPTRPVIVIGAITVAGYVALAVVAGDAAFSYVFLVATLLALTGAISAWQTRMGELQRSELRRVSRADSLTDCLNRRGFEERVEVELTGAVREGRPLALVLIDLDHFKAVNDEHGHAAGDELLCWTVDAIRGEVRPLDTVGRLGGDEFAVVLPGAGRGDAEAVVERLRRRLSDRISSTAGLACFPAEGTDRSELLRRADAALMEAKHGRSSVVAPSRRELSFAAALADAVDLRMAPTAHSSSVARLAAATGARLGWSRDDLALLRMAAMLHDVGKVAVPDHILRKRGPLTEAEYHEIKRHAVIGSDLVSRIDGLGPVTPWIRHSHEHYDGTGYPDGLAGEAIPLASRVLLVADAYDAMTTDRPYRSAMTAGDALGELRSHSGVQFDPACVDALAAHLVAEGLVAA